MYVFDLQHKKDKRPLRFFPLFVMYSEKKCEIFFLKFPSLIILGR